jgi:catechol 2,3-dioxygenase-like lactoylglutathione lyase family enzyme
LTKKHDRPILLLVEIDHLKVPVSDYERSKRFYADVLAPLGFAILLDWHANRRAYLGVPPATSSLWLIESTIAGALEIALAAPSAEAVDAFHAAAVGAGGRMLREPGIDPERSGRHYAARILDPDGNSIEAVHKAPAVDTRAAA